MPQTTELKILTELVKALLELVAIFLKLEEKMATRADIDAVKQALVQAIADAANRVSNDIQMLRDQLSKGDPVTDQDLEDLQNDVAAVGNIDPAAVPSPGPTP